MCCLSAPGFALRQYLSTTAFSHPHAITFSPAEQFNYPFPSPGPILLLCPSRNYEPEAVAALLSRMPAPSAALHSPLILQSPPDVDTLPAFRSFVASYPQLPSVVAAVYLDLDGTMVMARQHVVGALSVTLSLLLGTAVEPGVLASHRVLSLEEEVAGREGGKQGLLRGAGPRGAAGAAADLGRSGVDDGVQQESTAPLPVGCAIPLRALSRTSGVADTKVGTSGVGAVVGTSLVV